MDDRKEMLTLRVVAARFVHSDVSAGLAELDRLTTEVSRMIFRKYRLLSVALYVTATSTLVSLGLAVVLLLNESPGGEIMSIIGLVCFGTIIAATASWRRFQYGGMKASLPQSPVYADARDPAARNLERLFALLQSEATPRAFYLARDGTRRFVDERYFFGRLRAGHVAKDSVVRQALFGPIGLWFERELFLDVDVDKLIEKAKVKPQRGANRTYDFTDAIMSLIEHPEVRTIEVGKRGNQKKIKDLLEVWYRNKRLPEPGDSQLALYANHVLEIIAKNRQSKS